MDIEVIAVDNEVFVTCGYGFEVTLATSSWCGRVPLQLLPGLQSRESLTGVLGVVEEAPILKGFEVTMTELSGGRPDSWYGEGARYRDVGRSGVGGRNCREAASAEASVASTSKDQTIAISPV